MSDERDECDGATCDDATARGIEEAAAWAALLAWEPGDAAIVIPGYDEDDGRQR